MTSIMESGSFNFYMHLRLLPDSFMFRKMLQNKSATDICVSRVSRPDSLCGSPRTYVARTYVGRMDSGAECSTVSTCYSGETAMVACSNQMKSLDPPDQMWPVKASDGR